MIFRLSSLAVLALLTALAASPAAAQSAVACGAASPAVGTTIRGPVLQIIDARTVCVALGPLPEQWLALRLTRVPPRSKGSAQGLFAQTVVCKVTSADPARVRGACDRVEPEAPTVTATALETSQLP